MLHREIAAQGYQSGMNQFRRFLREIKPVLPPELVVRFETKPGEQMEVDWVEFRKGRHLQAISAAWRGDIAAANPLTATPTTSDLSNARRAAVAQQPLTAALLDRLLHYRADCRSKLPLEASTSGRHALV